MYPKMDAGSSKYPSSEAYKLFEPQPDTPGGPWYQLSDYWMQVLRRFQVYDKGESGPGTSAYYLYRLMLDRGTLSEAQMAALTAERSGQETLDVSIPVHFHRKIQETQ